MKIIYKYPVSNEPEVFELEMHKDAEILSVQVQNNTMQLWALVDTQKPKEGRKFVTIMTGCKILSTNSMKFIVTCQLDEGTLVLHLFELMP